MVRLESRLDHSTVPGEMQVLPVSDSVFNGLRCVCPELVKEPH